MELYLNRGYEQTTVADIAERAGLTERTFFRYFADKREVLFGGAAGLQELLVDALAGAPASDPPIDAVAVALEAIGRFFEGRREFARRRQAVIVANPELQERELIKLASLSAAMAETLRQRGMEQPGASLLAEAGVAVFRVAFEQWVTGTGAPTLAELMRTSLNELRAVTSGAVAGSGGRSTSASTSGRTRATAAREAAPRSSTGTGIR
jgi:AcrR family transcriptional regulator